MYGRSVRIPKKIMIDYSCTQFFFKIYMKKGKKRREYFRERKVYCSSITRTAKTRSLSLRTGVMPLRVLLLSLLTAVAS